MAVTKATPSVPPDSLIAAGDGGRQASLSLLIERWAGQRDAGGGWEHIFQRLERLYIVKSAAHWLSPHKDAAYRRIDDYGRLPITASRSGR